MHGAVQTTLMSSRPKWRDLTVQLSEPVAEITGFFVDLIEVAEPIFFDLTR